MIPTILMSDFLVFVLNKKRLWHSMPGHFDDAGVYKFDIYIDSSKKIVGLLRDAVWDVFVSGSNYLAPFWTIKFEVFGGLLALVLLLFLRNKSYVYKISILLIMYLIVAVWGNIYNISTLIGLTFYEILNYVRSKKIVLKKKYKIYLGIVTGAIFWLIVLWGQLPINSRVNYAYFCGVAWVMFMTYIFSSKGIVRKFLESKPINMLGKMSFQIYGVHYAIISSLGCLFVNQNSGINILLDGITIYLSVVGLTIGLAYVIWKINNVIQKNLVNGMFKYMEKEYYVKHNPHIS